DGPERSASSASQRGGHAEAAAALETAARLAEDDNMRAKLLRDAAEEAWRAGQRTRALGLLDDALAHASDGQVTARLQHLYGVIEMWSGSPLAASQRLNGEAERVAAPDPKRAAPLLTHGAWAGLTGRA